MDCIMNRLLKESVRFVELCQNSILLTQITIREYNSLAKVKLEFIQDILETQKEYLFIDKDMRVRLNKIFTNHNALCCLEKKAAGN